MVKSKKNRGLSSSNCPPSRPQASRWCLLLVFLVGAGMLALPASAGEKYMAGSPKITAAVSGSNEFGPGDDAAIAVRLQNEGLNEYKFVNSAIITRDDRPNTAKLVTVALGTADAPLAIKTDPQMIGDLAGGSSTLVNFNAKIAENATAGTYDLPLSVRYTYLWEADQYGSDTIQYFYREENETLLLPVRISPELQFEVVSSGADQLNAGMEGYLTVVVRNTGQEEGTRAVLKIARNGNSPVTPSDSSTYIGDFPPGAEVSSQFKVSVGNDAENKTYPLDLYVTYEDHEGDTTDTGRHTIGVPVGEKVSFAIVSDPVALSPGQKKVISVTYENTGGATVYNAQARISAIDPFTSDDDTAFLGTLAPGEKKEADFEVSVDSSATKKEYGLDTEVRFRDALDNSVISDPVKLRVSVASDPGAWVVPAVAAIVLIVLAGVGYSLYRKKKGAAR